MKLGNIIGLYLLEHKDNKHSINLNINRLFVLFVVNASLLLNTLNNYDYFYCMPIIETHSERTRFQIGPEVSILSFQNREYI